MQSSRVREEVKSRQHNNKQEMLRANERDSKKKLKRKHHNGEQEVLSAIEADGRHRDDNIFSLICRESARIQPFSHMIFEI